jgi:ABC-type amino acid transport substrate-binding protein
VWGARIAGRPPPTQLSTPAQSHGCGSSSKRGASRNSVAVTIAALGVAALALAACGADTTSPAAGTFTPRTPGVLTVVTSDVPSPGFWDGTPSHVTGGFEFELAKVLAQRLGLRVVRVKIEPFHRIVQGQLDGADIALDLITPTTERGQRLSFSYAYLNAAPTVVVRAGTSVPDLQAAQALRWGVVRATTFVGIIDSMISPNGPVRMYDSTSDMVIALERGQIDAALLDLPLAVVTADRSGGRLSAAAQLPDAELIAAALPKGSGNVQAVDSAFNAFTADGTIDHLLKAWVGSSAANAESSIPLLQTTL